VHDLRIATRRLLAQLELLQPLVPDRILRKVRRGLKKQLRATALLRDAQVQLLRVRALLPEHPELEPACRHLEGNEGCLRRLARRNLKGGGKLRRRLKAAGKRAESGLRAPNAILRYRASVRAAIRRASLRLEEFRRSPPRDSAGIHRLRIALRKFRYLVESLPAGLTLLKPEEIRLIRTHLDLMGEIHDLDLLIVRLRGIPAKRGRGKNGLEPVRRSLRRKYSAQMAAWRGRTRELFSSLDAISRADPRFPPQAGPGRPPPADP